MKHFLNLILPEKLEVLLWSVIGFVSLLILNVGRLVSWITDSSGTQNVDFIGKYLFKLDNLVDPRLIDFMVWVLAGIAVFLLFSILVAIFKTAGEEASILHYYKSPVGRYHEAVVFLSKGAVRLFGIMCVVFWLNFFINNVNPYGSDIFYTSITTIVKDAFSWLALILSVALYSAYLYLLAITARFITLKIRVFGDEREECDSHQITN
jgi:lipid-A-disaccharide synthase-like uncharacterized protein